MERFDELAKALSEGRSRRAVLRLLGGVFAAGALTAVGGGEATAAPPACAEFCRQLLGRARGACMRACHACAGDTRRVCVRSEAATCCAACESCTEAGTCVDACDPLSCTRCDHGTGTCVPSCGPCGRCQEEGVCGPCESGPSPGCCKPDGTCLICAPDEFADCTSTPPRCVPQTAA